MACRRRSVALSWLLDRPGVASVIVVCADRRTVSRQPRGRRLELSEEERLRLDEVSALPLIYPFWHQAKTASDRLGAAELSLLGRYLNDGS